MEADYPAAHSQDTTWFAIDAKGQVGVFSSGENGPIPVGHFQEGDLLEVLRRLHGQPTGKGQDPDWDAVLQEAAERGLFVYEYIDEPFDLPAPYTRIFEPGAPLHVDQLPPDLRKMVKDISFDKADFAQGEHIQPVEHIPCEFWSEEDVAYLASDGKTVRPVPGQEDRFREFCEEFRETFPEESSPLRFEGLEDEAGA
jgi:hypothetical protein